MNAHRVGIGLMFVSYLGCAGPSSTVVPAEPLHAASVRAAGVCAVTNGERGGSFTYADGFLVKIDTPADTSELEWEGAKLVRVVRRRGVQIVAERRFRYRADGRLVEEEELEAEAPSGLELSARRRFVYNDEGWLVGVVEDDTERDVERCSWGYQDGRPATITCWHPTFTSVVTLQYDDSGRNVAAETADMVAAEFPSSTDTYTYTHDGAYTGTTTTDARGVVIVSRRDERDEDARLRRVVYTTARTVEVLTVDYDGDFPTGFACGAPIEPPPGYPNVRAAPWLDLHLP